MTPEQTYKELQKYREKYIKERDLRVRLQRIMKIYPPDRWYVVRLQEDLLTLEKQYDTLQDNYLLLSTEYLKCKEITMHFPNNGANPTTV